ncbi:MAG: hypothetical protein EOO13_02270 [Chitinophagaceae bacterium]|nr:MAG: hypothetical protein EOO13_02270 [Chitinophagaceae bacterium]
MEQEFYRDEFEHLLKDSTDDFKMYPSRKVWHSIYNDLHPDRKWPSLAVCLLLLTIILYVGVTNNNAINNGNRKNLSAVSLSTSPTETDEIENESAPRAAKAVVALSKIDLEIGASFPVLSAPPIAVEVENMEADKIINVAEEPSNSPEKITQAFFENNVVTTGEHTRSSIAPSAKETTPAIITAEITEEESLTTPAGNPQPAATELVTLSTEELASLAAANRTYLLNNRDTREQEWIEDFAFHNKPGNGKRLLKGLSTQFYITPSIGYRVRFKNDNYKHMDNSLVTSNASVNAADKTELNQQATINLEAGAGIVKDLGKRLRFKTGLQFNYTDYITYAQKLEHPTQTTLIVSNSIPGLDATSYTSDYAHIPGNNTSKLHNRTIQLSVPVGMDYKILSNRVLNWYVGATVQPTFVTRGYTYLLSSDNNYFVEDQAMIRKLNLNGALESFVSIKTKSGTFINLGPQFRYQLFSTYNKNYTYTEKPYSVGFKIGFLRPL